MDEIIDRRDESIDVESIMKKIKENIRRRKEFGILRTGSIDNNGISMEQYNTSPDIGFITGRSYIGNYSYLIRSHRGFIGKLLVKGRQMVHDEVKRYVDPIFLQQSEWNTAAARILKENEQRSLILLDRVKQIEQHIQSDIRISRTDEKHVKILTEEELQVIIQFHEPFIHLIQTYAILSAKDNIPKVIEMGLNTGAISIFLSRDCNFNVFGIDNSIEIIYTNFANNKKLGGSTRFMQYDSADLGSIKEKFFDVAFSQDLSKHLDGHSMMMKLSNHLKIANYYVFSVPSINAPSNEHQNEQIMSLDDWRILLETTGFNILRLEYYHADRYIVGVIGQ